MKIRRAEKKDIPRLSECFGVLFRAEKDWNENSLLQKLAQREFFLGFKGKEAVGAVSLHCGSGVCLIDALAIKPEFQGYGLGKQLLNFAEKYARKKGCHKLWCFSLAIYKAKGFYLKMGFQQEGLLRKHWFGMDCYIFGKQI